MKWNSWRLEGRGAAWKGSEEELESSWASRRMRFVVGLRGLSGAEVMPGVVMVLLTVRLMVSDHKREVDRPVYGEVKRWNEGPGLRLG